MIDLEIRDKYSYNWPFPILQRGFPGDSVGKESACNEETDAGLIPGPGRSPEGVNGNPL